MFDDVQRALLAQRVELHSQLLELHKRHLVEYSASRFESVEVEAYFAELRYIERQLRAIDVLIGK